MNTQITLVFILTLTGSCIGYQQFTTQYDKNFDFTCSEPEFLTYVKSTHSSYYEDRIWEFRCDGTRETSGKPLRCNWSEPNIKETHVFTTSGHVNNYDETVLYDCGQNGIIQGIRSVHDNYYEDRRWSFYCCSSSAYSLTDCYTTNKLNEYDNPLEYKIPDGYVLRGVTSFHDNYYEDRTFWFQICKLNIKDSA